MTLNELKSSHRILVLVLICVAGAFVAYLNLRALDPATFKFGYLLSWGGAMFRASSGGALGFAVSRWGFKLDLSALPLDIRPLGGIAQAILVAGFAVAVALGT